MNDLTMIVARAKNGVIGNCGRIPWHVSEDLRRFKALTMGHTCIVGRVTWCALPPLPGRHLIVASRTWSQSATPPVCRTIEEAIAAARVTDPSPFVIGGAEVYRAALPYVTRIELTEVDIDVAGDTQVDLDLSRFRELARVQGQDPRLTFVTLERY